MAGRTSAGAVLAALRRSSYRSAARPVERIALVAASVDLYWLVFFRFGATTFVVLLLALLVWAGRRLRPLLAGLHLLAVCAVGVALTVAGQGPLAGATPHAAGAAVLQPVVAATLI